MRKRKPIVIDDSDEERQEAEDRARALRPDSFLHLFQIDRQKVSTSDGRTEWRTRSTSSSSIRRLSAGSIRPQPSPPPTPQPQQLTESTTVTTSALERATWPSDIAYLRDHFNPGRIVMPSVTSFGSCGCSSVCRADDCRNGRLGLYCVPASRPYAGRCGNGLLNEERLALARDRCSKLYGVIATADIHKGEILGEYLGELTTVNMSPQHRQRNAGNLLVLHHALGKNSSWRVAIDAHRYGSLLRFMNHSCEPAARFHEVASGRRHTAVAVASRAIKSGEEVTVSYGDDLWFVCWCRSPYPTLRTSSSRLGGADLGSYHELGARGGGEDDPRTPVASFTKTKRLRGEAAVTGLRKQLVELDAEAARAPTDIMQMMLLMREESEARRVEELQRRRDERFEKEAWRREEREEREERRRQERAEADERRRQDKEEAHARTQEILLLIGALAKRA
ncbi:hypothetical protein PybrP1_009145 [[Pythium] brassicae (nom. inval.)]|nr:hypothetical protein PybrP1_009145 [[Pythium] brassicae (nom. inval.)]